MKIKNIVIDSNFIIKNYNINSSETELLIKLKDFHSINLLIPEVVCDECNFNYKKEVYKAHADILSTLEKHKDTIVKIEKTKINQEEFMMQISKASEYFKPKIDRFITNNGISLIPYPKINHKNIVQKMYEGKIPFKEDKTEIGYKDYLIISSIKETVNEEDTTVILTRNIKDFCTDESIKKQSLLIPVAGHLDLPNTYVVNSVKNLSEFISIHTENHETETPFSNKEVEEFVKGLVTNCLYEHEIYGDLSLVDGNITNLFASILEIKTIQHDDSNEYIDINGKVKIQMDYSFTLNNFIYEMMSENFVFYNEIKKVIELSKYKEGEFWEFKFNDYNYCRIFDFSISFFDYDKGKKLEDALTSLYLTS